MNEQSQAQTILAQVHEGMHVYDVNSQKIGTVADLYLGASAGPSESQYDSAAAPVAEGSNLNDNPIAVGFGVPIIPVIPGIGSSGTNNLGGVLPVFAFEREIPEALRAQLTAQGFLQLNGTGILGASRYVTSDQIASVEGDNVHLNVTRDQLIKA